MWVASAVFEQGRHLLALGHLDQFGEFEVLALLAVTVVSVAAVVIAAIAIAAVAVAVAVAAMTLAVGGRLKVGLVA